MKFWLSPAFCDTAHFTGLARAAEEYGFEGIAIPDHLFIRSNCPPLPVYADGSGIGRRTPTGPSRGWRSRDGR